MASTLRVVNSGRSWRFRGLICSFLVALEFSVPVYLGLQNWCLKLGRERRQNGRKKAEDEQGPECCRNSTCAKTRTRPASRAQVHRQNATCTIVWTRTSADKMEQTSELIARRNSRPSVGPSQKHL
ncbi:hypothetical protein B0H19DRAFT_1171602 [Mycena capillaripes]|nr:hypothetical protein B0H19DRAFT_1171602 [Mycena capillaripes]